MAVATAGWFAARASVAAAAATAEAQRAAALASADAQRAAALASAEAQRAAALAAAAPAHQQVDLAILRETTERLDREGAETRDEVRGLRILVRALGRAYEDIWRWAASPVGPPPEPEQRVKDYLRNGA
jgi:hypothetical protein